MQLVELVSNFSYGDGISKVVLELSKRLKRYYDLTVVYHYATTEAIPFSGLQLSRIASLRYLLGHADVVHSHFGTGVLMGSIARRLSPKMRHISTHHVIPPREVSGSPYVPYYAVRAVTEAGLRMGTDRVVGISRYACEDLRQNYGIENSYQISNGVDTRAFYPDPSAARQFRLRHGINEDARLVGYIARFNQQKNHELLVRLAPKLPEDTLLVLGGTAVKGPLGTYEKCVSLAKQLGVQDRIRFVGYVPESELRGFYSSLQVFAFASIYESFGLSLLEAMCCQTPVVCLDGYAYPEVVDPTLFRNGLRARTEREFHNSVLRILHEPKLGRMFGRRGRRFAAGLDWKIQANKYKALLDSLTL